ncbi:MAG: hypothetical protein Q9160_003064 [Pyrenula sp. 1 TL-2023]
MPSRILTEPPPFPDSVRTAPLLRLSLSKLQSRDRDETDRFLGACKELGFFYLDLKGSADDFLVDADALFAVGESLFSLELAEKQKYDLASEGSYFGYKQQGAAVVNAQGDVDRNEFYNVSKDDILEVSAPLPSPSILACNRSLLKSFIMTSHSLVTFMLSLLNTHLQLPKGSLQNLHRLNSPSGDQVRFIKAPPQPHDDRRTALGAHTDFGSITILFNRLGGLQVLPPGKGAEWCYVKPLPGHAIVNLGDAMVKFTNGLLRSNIHRVMAPPGQQGDHVRYSLVYFSRPENDVPMKRLNGSNGAIPGSDGQEEEETVSSKDWILRRALGHRVALGKSGRDWDKGLGTEHLSRRE